MNKWNYCDEIMPPNDVEVMVLVAEEYEGKAELNTDTAMWKDGKLTYICNDWDEGQRWGVVAWKSLPDTPSKDEVLKHKWIV